MDSEVKHFTYISIELLMSSIVIAAIVISMSVAAMFMQNKETKDLGDRLVKDQADLYPYIQQGDKVSTSDVIDIITTYARVYDFVLYKPTGSPSPDNIYFTLTSKDPLSKWSFTNIKDNLSQINMTTSGDQFTGINWRMTQILTSDRDSKIAIVFFDTTNGLSGPSLDNATDVNIELIKEILGIEYNTDIK